jgi:hypothetical protein
MVATYLRREPVGRFGEVEQCRSIDPTPDRCTSGPDVIGRVAELSRPTTVGGWGVVVLCRDRKLV